MSKFGHILKDIEETDTDVLAHFSDGTSERGDVIIGADGGKSTVRKILFGPRAEPVPLPYELANFNVSFEDSQALIIRQSLKPFVDRGIHEKGMFFLMCRRSSLILFGRLSSFPPESLLLYHHVSR